MQQNPALVPVAAAAFFVGVWVVAVVLVSLLSGWWGLAEQYRTETPFPAHMRRFQRGQMRWRTNYGNILTVASDSRGLYLSVMFLFRLGHPPLFIPWADISFEDPKPLALLLDAEAAPGAGPDSTAAARVARRLSASRQRDERIGEPGEPVSCGVLTRFQ